MAKRSDNFSKFVQQKKNSAIKEEIKQEKKKEKKLRQEAIEKRFAEKRMQKQGSAPFRKPADRPADRPASRFSTNKPATGQTFNGKVINEIKTPSAYAKASADKADKRGPSKVSIQKPGTSRNPSAYAKASADKADKPGPSKNPSAYAKASADKSSNANTMPLNKYIAHSGICSRRDAAALVKEGRITVNGTVITEPGFKVSDHDIVKSNGKKLTPSRNYVYILLNKPKDYITTTDDPQGRHTVLELIRHATSERVYPIGRLDRNTSGVLLLTNDGELAQKLSHPKHEVKKVYHAVLDKDLTKKDFDKIVEGVKLEDGFAKVDALAYTDAKDKTQIGLEIHSGRNRIVRRIFEHLHYDVKGLDRVMYAGLTKKNVQRGKWRLLSEKEIRILKFMNKSYT